MILYFESFSFVGLTSLLNRVSAFCVTFFSQCMRAGPDTGIRMRLLRFTFFNFIVSKPFLQVARM